MRKQRSRHLSAALLSFLVIAGCGSKQAKPPISVTPPTTSAEPVPPAPPPVVSEPQKPDVQEPPKTVDPGAKLVAQMSLTEKIRTNGAGRYGWYRGSIGYRCAD
jgi:hypothetical protein